MLQESDSFRGYLKLQSMKLAALEIWPTDRAYAASIFDRSSVLVVALMYRGVSRILSGNGNRPQYLTNLLAIPVELSYILGQRKLTKLRLEYNKI